MSLAFPPVGTHSTALQLGHTTTVWEWLNTVVLQQIHGYHGQDTKTCIIEGGVHGRDNRLGLYPSLRNHIYSTYIEKHPWHLTSMKYEFGDSTRRFSLWLRFSNSAVGCNKSTSQARTYRQIIMTILV